MDVRMSQVVGALSHALDVTEGQPPGHAERTCLIGMRLARAIGLDAEQRSSLFYALLLKDAGCSTNSAQVASLYGTDDADVKRDRKLTDHLRPAESIAHLTRATAPGRPLAKIKHLRALVAHGSAGSRALTAMRCERGAEIARDIALDDATSLAIRHLDEHWDGKGYPDGLEGDAISLLGRIACLAQTAEVFWAGGGRDAAIAVARERSGRWFDPALADALAALPANDSLWASLESPDIRAVEPADRIVVADDERLDLIAAAFARVVDAKSPYTATHSLGVAGISVGLARLLGHDLDEQRTLHRAGLLHDLGKLAVSNRILDKPGKLDAAEWDAMRLHPVTSLEILHGVPAFADVIGPAGAHHERLDGSGYPYGLGAAALDRHSRIVAVADVAEALSAERPYREALPPEKVLEIMRRDAGTKLDPVVFEALEQLLPGGAAAYAPAPASAVGSSRRERMSSLR
jgi:HD-GYP domain-containing protein (c-di-GMP phosphodiesterase class II)